MRLVVVALLVAACSGGTQPPAATLAVPATPGSTLPAVGGSGNITFGAKSALDEDTLEINPSRSSFKVGTKSIAWSAELSEAAGATSLTWILARVGGSGSERIVWRQEVDVSNPTFDLIANSADLSLLLDRKPGTYVMRYLRDATILAEGRFTLTR